METFIENTNLDINSWLINWGLMRGYYKDGVIRMTKFGLINQLFVILLFLFEFIKWIILIFLPGESQIAHYLGEFTPSLGPKLILDAMMILETLNSLILLFYFGSCRGKLFFWLESMYYDNDKHCFEKLDLDKNSSIRFIKQFVLGYFLVKNINYFLNIITFFLVLICFYLFTNKYHFYYFTSIIILSIGLWYLGYHWFGLLMIFYQVINSLEIIIRTFNLILYLLLF